MQQFPALTFNHKRHKFEAVSGETRKEQCHWCGKGWKHGRSKHGQQVACVKCDCVTHELCLYDVTWECGQERQVRASRKVRKVKMRMATSPTAFILQSASERPDEGRQLLSPREGDTPSKRRPALDPSAVQFSASAAVQEKNKTRMASTPRMPSRRGAGIISKKVLASDVYGPAGVMSAEGQADEEADEDEKDEKDDEKEEEPLEPQESKEVEEVPERPTMSRNRSKIITAQDFANVRGLTGRSGGARAGTASVCPGFVQRSSTVTSRASVMVEDSFLRGACVGIRLELLDDYIANMRQRIAEQRKKEQSAVLELNIYLERLSHAVKEFQSLQEDEWQAMDHLLAQCSGTREVVKELHDMMTDKFSSLRQVRR